MMMMREGGVKVAGCVAAVRLVAYQKASREQTWWKMTTALPDNDDLLAEVAAAVSGGGIGKVNSLPDLCNMKASLALAESLARASLMTSPAAKRRLQARRLELGLGELPGYVPPKHLLLYLVRMGSFNSAPKIMNDDNQDDDINLPSRMTHDDFLKHCRKDLEDTPLVSRRFVNIEHPERDDITKLSSKIRVLQWNILSQSLGEAVDNFVACPDSALQWRRRRQQLSEEIVRYQPDIICLQEVDHFNYFQKTLSTQGFKGVFFPKPDSPCIYIKDNNGPDGCAIFYKEDRFNLVRSENRILEVWTVQSNQVAVLAILKEHESGKEVCVATTHLKARNGALLSTLRNEQGKDLLDFVHANAEQRPVILCGDFNAEPIEPIYSTVLGHDLLRLGSAYRYPDGQEPAYTTWKIREDGEVQHTIDYIFYSEEHFQVDALLQFPDGEEIGEGRVPSLHYPSDHFSLVADLTLVRTTENEITPCSL